MGISTKVEISGARECVVELVGLEPTTRVLWNAAVSDQLTLSDTWHSTAIDGHFYKREISGWKSPVFPARRQPSFPRRHHHRALTTRSAFRSC